MFTSVSECLDNLVMQVQKKTKKNDQIGYKKPLTPRFRSQISVQIRQLAWKYAAVAFSTSSKMERSRGQASKRNPEQKSSALLLRLLERLRLCHLGVLRNVTCLRVS